MPASARGDFDATTGRVSPAALGHSFDDAEALSEGLPLWISRGDGSAPIDPSELEPLFLPPSESIEGSGALRLTGAAQWITVSLEAAAEELAGRRIEVRFWQRPDGRRVGGGLYWEDPAGEPFPPLRLRPTGRVTDDGWEEWSSGPVDAELGGLFPPTVLELGDEAALSSSAGNPSSPWSTTAPHGVVIDALELRDLGPARVPAVACAGRPSAADPCGELGLCVFGRCVDPAVALGADPAPARLSGLLTHRMMQIALLEGGQRSRKALPQVIAGLALAAATPPYGFYRQIAAASRPLRDDHHSPPYSGHWWLVLDRGPFLGCALLGEADLLPDSPTLPLIARAEGAGLEVGDAIVRIDGEPALDWLARLDPLLGYTGDPAGREPAGTLHLLALATFLGSELELARCAAGLDAASGGCAAPTETVRISLAEAGEAVWSTGSTGGFRGYGCEPRVVRRRGSPRHDPGGADQPFVGEDGGVRYLRFDDFIGSISAFDAALADGPGRVIVDERIGNGGFSSEVDYLGSFFVDADERLGFEDAYFCDGSTTETEWSAMRSCQLAGGTCGGFFAEPLPLSGHPSPSVSASARVAVLTHRDVSGNDFFTEVMRSRAGATRIFGPGPTAGAFGGVVGLPRRSGEVSGGAIQVADSRLLPDEGRSSPFLTGTGVAPDERLLQRQGDLLRGVDTVLEAADGWVRQ